MKKYDYIWELNGKTIDGSKEVDNEAALRVHIERVGGKLVEIKKVQDVVAGESGPVEIVIPELGKALKEMDGLSVRQQKEWGEIITKFECLNRYTVLDRQGRHLFNADEQEETSPAGFIARLLLKALRPFTIHISESGGMPAMLLKRPFRFYFHQLDIYDSNDTLIGRVLRHFHLLNRVYTVVDPASQKVCFVLYGPLIHPWTFRIYQGDKQVGSIKKRWSGFLKEAYTDADHFTAEFSKDMDLKSKKLLLAAIFLIDFVHFENTSR